jgi:hypothetical protein
VFLIQSQAAEKLQLHHGQAAYNYGVAIPEINQKGEPVAAPGTK